MSGPQVSFFFFRLLRHRVWRPRQAQELHGLPPRQVRYCSSVDFQRVHCKQHKKACKLRSVELKGEELYRQGHERLRVTFCPLCTLPIPLPTHEHSTAESCCAKTLYDGCQAALQPGGELDC
mmetsp:Transcript_24261/g.55025  ORF Transcript_24261/g.55025 Transcript_24261/m.55025 type:complete len:122 (+) Transcript_24261:268-633(+)